MPLTYESRCPICGSRVAMIASRAGDGLIAECQNVGCIANRDRLAALVTADILRHPRGHPCRDCGSFYDEHPTAACPAWR